MPIRPELMPLYPGGSIRSEEWQAIRGFKLHQAGNRCEQCGVEDGSRICRGEGLYAGEFMTFDGDVFDDTTGKPLGRADLSCFAGRMVDVVLTIAHLDHHPANNVLGNLRALCQLCHNRHDVEHRRQTRRMKKAVGDLFDGATR